MEVVNLICVDAYGDPAGLLSGNKLSLFGNKITFTFKLYNINNFTFGKILKNAELPGIS